MGESVPRHDTSALGPGRVHQLPQRGRRGGDRGLYHGRLDRLVALKNEYDLDNRFRTNQNIEPTV
ncbi:BBE domain-containing protein [Natrinema gelatinilyticum]|uniref:BBE domain-containing protein n=1 Tax=Natrinema gelatinilyticum TaxID=2961571 RepID=UPI003CE481CD